MDKAAHLSSESERCGHVPSNYALDVPASTAGGLRGVEANTALSKGSAAPTPEHTGNLNSGQPATSAGPHYMTYPLTAVARGFSIERD